MKASEIKELGQDDLAVKLRDLREEFFNLRFQHGVGQLENTSLLNKIKKDIARVKTTIRAKM